MNLTITVDDETLRRARIRALSQGTSVNAVLRELLESYAGSEAEAAPGVSPSPSPSCRSSTPTPSSFCGRSPRPGGTASRSGTP